MPTVWIPALLRDLTGGRATVRVAGSTLAQVFDALERAHPGIKERLYHEGDLSPFVEVAVDGEVATLGLRSPVGPDSEVHILPAVAGGRCGPDRALTDDSGG